MQKSKALVGALVLFISIALGAVPPAWADRNLRDLQVTVEIAPNGSAHFTEEWTVFEDGTGTEVFKRLGRLPRTMEIIDYKVSEDGTPYTFEPKWRPSATWEEKYQKYGIVKGFNKIELGWGRGKMGVHTYKMEYTVTNFIMNLKDAQVINWQFLNDHLSARPQRYQYVIKSPKFGPETVEEIHVYGNDPHRTYQNNQILLKNDHRLLEVEYLVLLAKLPAGTFDTKTNVNQTYLETLEISNTTDPDEDIFTKLLPWSWDILTALGAASVLIGIHIRSKFVSKRQTAESARRKETLLPNTFKETNIYPQVPKDTPEMIWQMALLADDHIHGTRMKKHLLTAYVLKWILEGRVKVAGSKTQAARGIIEGLQLDPAQLKQMDHAEGTLYKLLLDASDSEHILETYDLREFCQRHPKRWPNSTSGLADRGKVLLSTRSLSEEVPLGGSFKKAKIERLSQQGALHYQQALGFKNYLAQSTLINEREVAEVHLWKQYLIYGALFDLTKTVYQQLKKIMPEELSKYNLTEAVIHVSTTWAKYAETGTESAFSDVNSSGFGFGSDGGGGGGGGSAGGSSGGGFR
ncbi:hypothetical protein BSR29_05510 [Boudabousia liubingyangii]|uniref:DUF2207 domain-containing protein n=1 Tax=Boudabousia liubingyangii TaxID=1921764 RepID=A0A1Q5PLK6_9ACTO|nr:DUF2207 domain-containing protein [Boudabousia liubingyangii]OKL47938.1 hypothetical protein BSR29_05510 [Boudabousia liubingyangii]